jgi:hypothetical protein
VERTYWYHECAADAHAAPDPGVVHNATAVERAPEPPNPLLQSRLRVLVMPVADSATIERLIAGLAAQEAVRSAELEQFDGRSALLGVETSGASNLIAVLLRLQDFSVAGLTVTAEGQLNVRLDESAVPQAVAPVTAAGPLPQPTPATQEQAPSAPAPAPLPAAPPSAAAPGGQEDLLATLRASVERLSGISRAIVERGEEPFTPQLSEQPTSLPSTQRDEREDEPAGALLASAGSEAANPLLFPARPAPVELEDDARSAYRPSSWLFGEPSERTEVEPEEHDERAVFWQEDVFPIPTASFADGAIDSEACAAAQPAEEPATDSVESAADLEPLAFVPAEDRRSRLFMRNEEEGELYQPVSSFSLAPAPAESTGQERPMAPSAPAAIAEREPEAQPAPANRVLVVASPFQNFAVVNSFITAIRSLPDVHNVAPRRFRDGAIELAIDYSGRDRLGAHIRGLSHFEPEIVSDDGQTVTVQIGGRA